MRRQSQIDDDNWEAIARDNAEREVNWGRPIPRTERERQRREQEIEDTLNRLRMGRAA